MVRGLAILPLLLLLAAFAPGQDRSFMVGSFDRIRVDGPYHVTVTQGRSPAARAVGDRDSLEQVEVRLSGTTLVVTAGTLGWQERTSPAEAAEIHIVAPHLRGISVNGGGRATIAAMDGERVEANVNGAGAIIIDKVEARDFRATLIGTGRIAAGGESRSARLLSNGAGSIDAGALTTGDLSIVSQSTGGIAGHARYTARILATGAGTVSVTGAAKCEVSGPGPVTCEGEKIRR
tara:strand:- start:53 stop:754 length:702 start_codon:yes stop_codon:yes gene_type:complete